MNEASLFSFISTSLFSSDPVVSTQPQSGGCLNQVYTLQTRSGKKALLKFNSFDKPKAFRLEAEALDLIRSVSISTPRVIDYGRKDDLDYLVLEYIEKGVPVTHYWTRFGESLAKLHSNTQPEHGWKEDNYIGPLTQHNRYTKSWIEFFIQSRLEPQLKTAVDEKKMNEVHAKQFHRLFSKLDQYIPEESPALLHGDLWSGNILIDAKGLPVVIDPALYYGHREIELAYTQLFDRFDKEFYHAYESVFPLIPGFTERIRLHQLYPLMVHVNLFGGGYVEQVSDILRAYV